MDKTDITTRKKQIHAHKLMRTKQQQRISTSNNMAVNHPPLSFTLYVNTHTHTPDLWGDSIQILIANSETL